MKPQLSNSLNLDIRVHMKRKIQGNGQLQVALENIGHVFADFVQSSLWYEKNHRVHTKRIILVNGRLVALENTGSQTPNIFLVGITS